MLHIKIIAAGTLKEKFLVGACGEYQKRLGAFCHFDITEIDEYRLNQNPSDTEIEKALKAEGDIILAKLPKKCYTIALCVEGKQIESEILAEKIGQISSLNSNVCFIIGSSHGISRHVKEKADFQLSMSKMTFPHQLVRVMLLEQIYRAFSILTGHKYHK